MSKSKYGVMGVSLTVFIGPKFTLVSLWHQWVLSHEDLNKYSMVLGANVVLCMTVSDFFLGGGDFFFGPINEEKGSKMDQQWSLLEILDINFF